MLPRTVRTGINLILTAPNYPVLGAWGILYALTARVLLGAFDLESGGARCARRPYTHAHRTARRFRAVRSHLSSELAFFVC